jgi:excisionase family DNA binding protein
MSIHSDRPASAQTPYPEVWGLEALMDIGELAAYLGVLVATIYDWRVHAKGPTAFRFGKHLRFAVSDVRAWVAAQREPSGQAGGTDGR